MATGKGTLCLSPPGQGWRWPEIAAATAGDCAASPLKLLGMLQFSGDGQKKPTKKGKETPPPPPGAAGPTPRRGTSPASTLRYPEVFLTDFFPQICLSSRPSPLNYETSRQAKPMPEEVLGAAAEGCCLVTRRLRGARLSCGIARNVNMNLSCQGREDKTLPRTRSAPPALRLCRTQPPRGSALRKDHLFMKVHLLQS